MRWSNTFFACTKWCSRPSGWPTASAFRLCVGATFSHHSKQQKVAQTILRLFCTSQSSLCACWWALHQFLRAQRANGPPGGAHPAFWYKRWVCQSCHPFVSESPNFMHAVFVRLMTAWLRERHAYVHSCNHYASVLLSTRAGDSKGNMRHQKLTSSHTGEGH